MYFKNLKRYFLFGCIINITCILFVGALSARLAGNMMDNIVSLGNKSGSADLVTSLQKSANKSLMALHHYLLYHDTDDFNSALEAIEKGHEYLALYISAEEEHVNEENIKEFRLLQDIQKSLNKAGQRIKTIYADQEKTGLVNPKTLTSLEYDIYTIQEKVNKIGTLHTREMNRLTGEANQKMHQIIVLYVLFCAFGIIASFLGFSLLVRRLLDPIKELNTVTEKVSLGDYTIRLHTDSDNEIGRLYNSFNYMTNKLQENASEQKDFNVKLENLVAQRTASLREKERSLIQAQNEIVRVEKIATLGQIATSVNHEIRTPLNVLGMNVQLLAKKLAKMDQETNRIEQKEELTSITRMIDNEVARINDTLEEFVTYAKISHPTLIPKDINDIIQRFAEGFKERANEMQATLNLELAPDIPKILLDENKIIQTLLNLCTNALNAMPYGGNLTIRSTSDGKTITLSITDTGGGIPAHDLPQIFEPFFTTHEGGMGLGLPIVERIIEDHKGTITCTSKPDAGTTFTLHFPINT